MLCDNCVHAYRVGDTFDCDCKLDPRVPWIMWENRLTGECSNCALYKEVE